MFMFVKILVLLVVPAISRADQCAKPADIAFVIDSSRSIWIYHFNKQTKFVQEIVRQFDVGPGPDQTHIAALTFGDVVNNEFYFNEEFQSTDEAVARIGKIEHAYGSHTFTDDALKSMRNDIFSPSNGARDDVPKICIVLTDGESSIGHNPSREAHRAKEEGIKIIAIGIGHKVNEEELLEMTSSPDNTFMVDSFSQLANMKFQDIVGYTACNLAKETTPLPTTTTTEATTTTATTTTTTTAKAIIGTIPITPEGRISPEEMQKEEAEKTCQGKEADIVFVLDESTSIWVEFFKDQLAFVSDVIGNFDVDTGKTRVGVVTFSDKATVQFHLNEHQTSSEISTAVLAIKMAGGITNTHLALETVLDEMFSEKQGSRPGIAHICILITDGRSSKPKLTIPQAELVHDAGIYVFALGVGNMTDHAELAEVASKPSKDFTFEVDGYKALPSIKNLLAYKTCEVPSGDQPRTASTGACTRKLNCKSSKRYDCRVGAKDNQGCAGDIQADIVFGLHGIGGTDRTHVGEFIKSVGGAFDLETGSVRVGVVESCGDAAIELDEYPDKETYIQAVGEAMSSTIAGLLYRARMAFGKASSRSKVDRVVVLMVSGEISDMEQAYLEALRIKFNTRIIVVGVGQTDPDQLQQLASYRTKNEPDISHIFPVSGSTELADIVRKILQLMCNEQK